MSEMLGSGPTASRILSETPDPSILGEIARRGEYIERMGLIVGDHVSIKGDAEAHAASGLERSGGGIVIRHIDPDTNMVELAKERASHWADPQTLEKAGTGH